jgi:hypothetical protein
LLYENLTRERSFGLSSTLMRTFHLVMKFCSEMDTPSEEINNMKFDNSGREEFRNPALITHLDSCHLTLKSSFERSQLPPWPIGHLQWPNSMSSQNLELPI